MTTSQKSQSLEFYDSATFFEKAFRYAVKHAVLDPAQVATIVSDAATGTVQIAEYFGASAHLRHSLEAAKTQMAGLVSLYLEDATHGNLTLAAQLLKEKPFRTLSRGGSQMLKALYLLPEDDALIFLPKEAEKEFLEKCLADHLSVATYHEVYRSRAQFKQDLSFAFAPA